MELAGTSRRILSFAGIPNSSGIASRFNPKGITSLGALACQESKESWRVDHFYPEDSHLTSICCTFIDDIESVRRYWIAILAGEEREAMKRIHAD